jgi:hypothetical protein
MGSNRSVVKQLFNLPTSLYDKYSYIPSNIHTADEVLEHRGKGKVGGLSSADTRVSVIAETCMNAPHNLMETSFVISSGERE